MPQRKIDILTGLVFLALAVVWCSYVVETIPAGAGGGDVGPRAFPLLLGVLLGIVSVVLVLLRLFAPTEQQKAAAPSAEAAAEAAADRGSEWASLVMVLAALVGYGWAMPKIGFVLATALVIALMMVFALRDRSPVRLVGMTVGIPAGCWLLFGKLLELPLAHGSWISIG